ncbi:putative inactive cadmium/zinc-transporting ATPase HMA3 isoform X1 [Glycine soja]|uniref:Cadmium/zinc-transporting ATPase 3 n=1 Tax=Glycine soja TaxID=3848 RepID=A0A0B2SK66_GLYSO|nr:putative inactive cadmium/zinc-transporting ATPase HMA3 isoform X1 [Glycine soja]KHN45233.1 Cadmium/zinc-transporting ATPase 3 [Glycine soja]RZB90756.1 Cadmium/zinc-transporting ATPase HMA2 isoform A [Glycine soja]RZB90757.1 Cadmium/zinc-transporting ATPase HMA2 isoform B [Glycine soja]RZB90759.1 Cadmium/zinc-transporting ATPase HMA2 isoform D [Glycine soja]
MVENMKRSSFEVLGMCCATEEALVERILKPLRGVKDVSVIVPTRTVTVVHDVLLISESQIADALNAARLEASLRLQGETDNEKKWPDLTTMVCGLLLALSFLKYAYQPLGWLALGSVVIGFPKVLLRAIASIKALTLNINILVLLAVCGTAALQDFWEAGIIIFLFSIAQWLETRATHKAMVAMSSLTSMAPQKAVIAETGELVDVNDVKINTILAVKAGDAIPLDGIVVEGKCEVDEKMLTGESLPVTKELDSVVWAGTINVNGYISVKTTVLAKDTVVARMSKLVEEASSRKSRTQRFIDHFAKYYIPAVVLISASIAVVPAALKVPNIKPWFHLAIVVLLSACPCALILSTPVAIFCALTKAAISGLLLKGGDYIETLSGIKTVAFDKTGTITRGEFTVTDFSVSVDDISIETLLYWVSSVESKSSHPMAAALVEYGMLNSVKPIPENVENFQNFPGEGVYGIINGKDIYIGNRRIGARAGSERVDCRTQCQSHEISTPKQYCGPTLVGVFRLADTCRSGALEAIEELKLLGVRSVMLTGDSSQAAMYAQSQLNHALDIVHAELLPAEKAVIIENFKKDGLIAMIGDGMNDAPALATADIGISMGISGSALANETGNAILMSNDIRKIPEAIRLARKTTRKLIENVIISIGFKSVILALAIAGYPIVWLAVLTDVGTCLLVILNSMLILQEKTKYERKSTSSKYGTFSEDMTTALLDKKSNSNENKAVLSAEKCGKDCCKNDTYCEATTNKNESSGLSKLSSLKGNHNGNLVSIEVHIVKPCNGCGLGKVKMCEDFSCRTNNSSSDCCQEQSKTEKSDTGSIVTQEASIATLESDGYKGKSMDISKLSGTSVTPKCCKNLCCNDSVNNISNLSLSQPEIVIE